MGKSTKVTRSMINREITRIRNIVRLAEKEGYVFTNAIPKNANVTKSTLNRLRSITRESLLKNARRVDTDTGVFIDTPAERKIEQKRITRKNKQRLRQRKQAIKDKRRNKNIQNVQEYDNYLPTFSDIVIDNFRAKFSRMPPDISSRINGLLTQLINEQGADDVAVAIENLAPKMIESLVASGYTTDYIVEQLGLAIIENMPNASDQYKYDIADAYESYETGYEIGDY